MFTLILLALSTAWAVDAQGPSWPDGATLEVQETSTDASAGVQLTLTWPEAADDAGIAAYWVFQERVEHARLDADTLSWSGSVSPYPPRLSIVPVDTAGNIGPRLSGRFEVSEAHFLQPTSEPGQQLSALDQADDGGENTPEGTAGSEDASSPVAATSTETSGGHSAGRDAVESSPVERNARDLSSKEDGPPNLSLRVGRQGEDGTLLDVQFRYLADSRPAYFLRDGDRRLELQLSYDERGGVTLWRVELYAEPISRTTRLSRLTIRDPLNPTSPGSCARDIDYDKTGGLWVEVGVDPKGSEPRGACATTAE